MSFTVNLSKNSWHYKLQAYVWGSNQPRLTSLCPYFWFTIATVLFAAVCAPFAALLFALHWGFVKPLTWLWMTAVYNPLQAYLMRRTRAWIQANDIMAVLVQIGHFKSSLEKVDNHQPTFLTIGLDKEEVIDLLTEMYGWDKVHAYMYPNTNKLRAKQSLISDSYAVEKWNPLWWKSVVKYTEMIAKGLLVAFCGALVIAAVGALIWAFLHMPAGGWTMMGIVAASIVGLILFAYLLVAYICPAIKRLFSFLGDITYDGRSLMLNFIVSSFKSACPGINWEVRPEDIDPYHGE